MDSADYDKVYLYVWELAQSGGFYARYDMINGDVEDETSWGGSTYLDSSMTNLGDGWYLVSIKGTTSASTTMKCTIRVVKSVDTQTYTGNGVDGIFIKELQLKEGNLGTYTETTSSAVSTPSSITSVTNDCVWVDVFPTVNYNGTDYALSPEYHRAFIGYGYFEDGVNPLLIDYSPTAAPNDYKEILNESPSIILPTGEDFEIAVDSNLIDTVEYFDSSDVSLKLDTITGSDASSSQIIYSTSPDAVITSYVVVTNLDASTSQISVTYQDECLYTPYRLTFINRNGVYERLWFFKNSEKKASYEKDEFRRNTMSAGNYNLVDHQQKNLFKKSKETLKINSGFYSEDFNEVFNQLMLSESVWINYNSKELPVNIKDSSFTFKSRFNEKIINHTLELEFAFDKVNSVR